MWSCNLVLTEFVTYCALCFIVAVIMLAVVPLTPGLKIGSFNAMRLGQRKMENEAVVNILVDVSLLIN